MPVTNYLVYWKRDGFNHKNGDPLKFAVGAQLKKVNSHDRLYIISWTKKTGFIFVGRIIVERVVGLKEAQDIMNLLGHALCYCRLRWNFQLTHSGCLRSYRQSFAQSLD